MPYDSRMNASSREKRVAFFGGSFDPPHLGHLAVARAARRALDLDTVLFAPVGAQPLKPQGATASFEHRLAMTRLAIAGDPGFELSLADQPKASGAPNYTLETLLSLRAELPQGGVLYCLMGADSFMALRHWRRAAEIPFVAPLIVASRPGQPLANLKHAVPEGLTMEAVPSKGFGATEVEVRCWDLRNQAGERAPFYLLPELNVDVSASEIRSQVRAALGSQAARPELLPPAVFDYIHAHDLYLEGFTNQPEPPGCLSP
jgi:nicotinate-nucleotide adenylyltransferase